MFIWIPDAQERQTSITLTRKGAKRRHVAAKGDTFVNGHSTTECLLQNGDVIQVASSAVVLSRAENGRRRNEGSQDRQFG